MATVEDYWYIPITLILVFLGGFIVRDSLQKNEIVYLEQEVRLIPILTCLNSPQTREKTKEVQSTTTDLTTLELKDIETWIKMKYFI